MGYTAAKQVAIGTGQDDPERPGMQEVKIYEPGDEVDVSGIDNVQALVDQGYLNDDSAEDDSEDGGDDE